MRRAWITILVVSLILALGLVAGCGSSEPVAVSGTGVRTNETFEGNPVAEANKLTVKGTSTWDVTGDMVGTSVVKYSMPVNMTTGDLTMDYTNTFTGKIGDKSGTFTTHGVGAGKMTSQTDGTYTMEETVTGGTGDFEGITGTMHTEAKTSSSGGDITYTGTLQYK